MDVDIEAVDNNVTEEHLLRRLLYLGTVEAALSLRGGCNKKGKQRFDLTQACMGGINKQELDKLQPLLQPQPGMTNVALQHCLAAMKSDLVDKRALFLVLSAILKINCKATKTAAYEAIRKLIETPEDLFEFLYYHRKIFNKKPLGMGRGMRNVVKGWYLKQDPYDLALEVSRVRSRHSWSHADIIKLARVNSKDTCVSAVLSSLVRGTKKTIGLYKDKVEAQPLIEYLKCVRDLNCCSNPDEAAALIANHSFDIESVPTHLRKYAKVWEQSLIRTPLRGVLTYLRVMTKYNFLSQPNSPVLTKLLTILQDNIALKASQLDPLDILGVLVQVEAAWSLPSPGVHKAQHELRVPKHRPHPSVAEELKNMMNSSFMCVSKLPMSMILCLDGTPLVGDGECFGAHKLKISRALSVLIISLLHSNTDLTVVYCVQNETGLQPGVLVRTMPASTADSVEVLEARISDLDGVAPDPVFVCDWVRRTRGHVEMITCATHSHVEKINVVLLAEEMRKFRTANRTVKFIYWALHCRKFKTDVRDPNNPNMLDIAGWSADIKRIIQAFGKDLF